MIRARRRRSWPRPWDVTIQAGYVVAEAHLERGAVAVVTFGSRQLVSIGLEITLTENQPARLRRAALCLQEAIAGARPELLGHGRPMLNLGGVLTWVPRSWDLAALAGDLEAAAFEIEQADYERLGGASC